MTTEVRRLVASAILSELGRTGRDSAWLARRSGIGHGLVEVSLAGERDLTVEELVSIANALAVSPARLVPAPPFD